MKKVDFSEFDRFEKIWGGVLGAIAIIAAVLEMIFTGISAATIMGAIKDVASTLIVVMVLLVALKKLFPKRQKGFYNIFLGEMKAISDKYAPIIQFVDSEKIEYSISDNISCIYGKDHGNYHRFFAFAEKDDSVTFNTSKTLFFGKGNEGHDKELADIALDIAKTVDKDFDFIEKFRSNKNSFTLVLAEPLDSDYSAKELARIIDKILLLYVAKCTKCS